ncbi:phosphatase [Gottfriedia acidiceleris]|uniref:phosphatase n=1 Tax=Gottfriedia acidiceleris TaxID=371036 RepID=UPI00101DF10A|nr:phosphatase [Gottfriedia acidiceleris]
MKNLIIGGIAVLSSILLYGMTLISASIYSLYLTAPDYGGGWNRNYGVFGTALEKVGIFPLLLSVIFFVIGIRYIIKSIKV